MRFSLVFSFFVAISCGYVMCCGEDGAIASPSQTKFEVPKGGATSRKLDLDEDAAALAATPDDFYVLPGQGTCTFFFTTIGNERIAIILDAGAFDGVHPKFSTEGNEIALLRPKPIITEPAHVLREDLRNRLSNNGQQTTRNQRCLRDIDPNSITPKRERRPDTEPSIEAKDCSAQKQKDTLNLGQKIHDIFVHQGAKRIICFFSHCDRDHWNLHDVLPELPTIYMVGLGWNQDKLSVLAKTYAKLCRVREEVVNEGFGDYLLARSWKKKIFNECGYDDDALQALNKIHIWGVNLCKGQGHNENSMLLSVTSASLNMTFFATGDATTETFEALKVKGVVPSVLLCEKRLMDSTHLVFAFVPHHGSHITYPEGFLSMINPDGFIITAGRGASYGHPRMEVVGRLLDHGSRNIWQRFNMVNPVELLGFEKRTSCGRNEHLSPKRREPDQYYSPKRVRLTPDNPLILGTNISGCLRFSIEGIFQEFNPFLEINGTQYIWDYLKHRYESDKSLPCQSMWDFVEPVLSVVVRVDENNIGYDSDNNPVAYFIEMPDGKWYGYPIQKLI